MKKKNQSKKCFFSTNSKEAVQFGENYLKGKEKGKDEVIGPYILS
jgi:hypothetical protein